MYVNEVLTAISSVGFPIVAAGACFWFMLKQSEQHKSDMKEVTTAINNNTLAITKLVDKLECS